MRARIGVRIVEAMAHFGGLLTLGAAVIVQGHTVSFIPELAVEVNDC